MKQPLMGLLSLQYYMYMLLLCCVQLYTCLSNAFYIFQYSKNPSLVSGIPGRLSVYI